VKLEKKNLQLDEFLESLDLEALKKSLLHPDTMHSTNYNEEDAVNIVAKKRSGDLASGSISVMNAALPPNPVSPEETKKLLEERKN